MDGILPVLLVAAVVAAVVAAHDLAKEAGFNKGYDTARLLLELIEETEMTDDDFDYVLERWDQTEPTLQRQIVARLLADNLRMVLAVEPIMEAAKTGLHGSDPLDRTYNSNYHVEMTVSVGELRQLWKVFKRSRKDASDAEAI